MKALVKGLALTVVTVVLAGCSVVSMAGAAATVDGLRLSNDEVAASYDAVAKLTAGQGSQFTAAELNRQIVGYFVFSHLVLKLGESQGVDVTDAQLAQYRKSYADQSGGEKKLQVAAAASGIAPDQIDLILRMSMTFDAMVSKYIDPTNEDVQAATDAATNEVYSKLAELAKTVEVEVAPRYGSWSSEQLTMSDLAFSDVVVTTDQLAQMAAANQ